MIRRSSESCPVLQHHLSAEVQRLSAENQKLLDRLLAIDHEEIERSRPLPQPRRRPRPAAPIETDLSQADAYPAPLRAMGASVGLYGSAAAIEEQAAARSALGPVEAFVEREATLAAALAVHEPLLRGVQANLDTAAVALDAATAHWGLG